MSQPTQSRVQVTIELGHTASFRKKPTPEGFTHDWMVFVRGPDGSKIQHFIEKVVFNLHDTFTNPKRRVKEPPYQVSETGYASFLLPIDIYFRNKELPKKISLKYNLYLNAEGGPPINHTRCEMLTFQNPTEEFRQKLLKAGGIQYDNPAPTEKQPQFTELFGNPITPEPSNKRPSGGSSSGKDKSSRSKSSSSKPSTPQSSHSSASVTSTSSSSGPGSQTIASKEPKTAKPNLSSSTTSSSNTASTRETVGQKRPSTSSPPERTSGKKMKRSSSTSSTTESSSKHKSHKSSKKKPDESEKSEKSDSKKKSSSHHKDKSQHKETKKKDKSDSSGSRSKSSSNLSKSLPEFNLKAELLSPLHDSPPRSASPLLRKSEKLEDSDSDDMSESHKRIRPSPKDSVLSSLSEDEEEMTRKILAGKVEDDSSSTSSKSDKDKKSAKLTFDSSSDSELEDLKPSKSQSKSHSHTSPKVSKTSSDTRKSSPLKVEAKNSPVKSETKPTKSRLSSSSSRKSLSKSHPKPKDSKEVKDAKESKETKDSKDLKETRETKDSKVSKEFKDSKDVKDSKELKDKKDRGKSEVASSSSKHSRSSSKDSKSSKDKKDRNVIKGRDTVQCENGIPEKAPNGESIKELLGLQATLCRMRDRKKLQIIADLIGTTGLFKITETAFTFDLCNIDSDIVKKISTVISESQS